MVSFGTRKATLLESSPKCWAGPTFDSSQTSRLELNLQYGFDKFLLHFRPRIYNSLSDLVAFSLG